MVDNQDKELRLKVDRKSYEGDVSLLEEFYSDTDPTTLSSSRDSSFDDVYAKPPSQSCRLFLYFLLRQFLNIFTSILLAIFDTILPSFITRWGSLPKQKSNRMHSQTAYLDGLRGIATLIVYLVHFVVNWFPVLKNKYGAAPGETYFLQLPIIRVFFSGHAAVACFFVVSGYALSYSALTKIRKEKKMEAFETLSSSTFRRCMRLYLPCAAATLICMLLSYNDLFTQDPLFWDTLPPQLPTFNLQFRDWWNHQKDFMYPFIFVEGVPYSPPYNGHLWTIPLEVRGSWVTYGTVLASANLSPVWRMAFLIAWDSYLWYMGKWDLFLFVSGILIANMDIPRHIAAANKTLDNEVCLPTDESAMIELAIRSSNEASPWSSNVQYTRNRSMQLLNTISPLSNFIRGIWPYFLFILAMYLLSFEKVPWGVDFLISWTPDYWDTLDPFHGKKPQAWRCIGAALLAYSLSLSAGSSPSSTFLRPFSSSRFRNINLQSLFTNTFSQYLGRISFGLYLMHGPVLFTIGTKLLVPAWATWDAEAPDPDVGKYVRAFCWAAVCNTIVAFWAADIFTRVIDERSVRFANRIAKLMSAKAVK
ncbi:hypothetical protein BDZ45DRAFT_803789 [Acephala macrosclerotiorum]|nr:hypothetical protein BDZ45DRAFT_803789 [Acephala macrosclerotiorum]